MKDPLVVKYDPSELKIAAEFLTTWLPFLTRDLCHDCTQSISNRVRSLDPPPPATATATGGCCSISTERADQLDLKEIHCDCDSDANSLGSWKENATTTDPQVPTSSSNRVSWADMAQEEDQLDEEEEEEDGDDHDQERSNNNIKNKALVGMNNHHDNSNNPVKVELSRQQREYIRFRKVGRKKDFTCLETVKGKTINILQGLELHTSVFSAAEQKRIVSFIYQLQDMGRKGELRERTFSAPQKWMRGKGRVTIQFGCCYNYAVLKDGKPPGILRDEYVDPIPHLFKVMIRRLIGWHVLPPSCVPDSCIVNIYDEGDCIPPHIDHHDFVRPFCTVSFLSECNILFGSNLKALGPGEFSGAVAIPLPVGSVLVLNENGADVAKHCVPAVPTKRISITFRKMDQSKHPYKFVPEPDLQGLQPLPYEVDESNSTNHLNCPPQINKQTVLRETHSEKRQVILSRGGSPTVPKDPQIHSLQKNRKSVVRRSDSEKGRGFLGRDSQSEPRFSSQVRSESGSTRRVRVSLET